MPVKKKKAKKKTAAKKKPVKKSAARTMASAKKKKVIKSAAKKIISAKKKKLKKSVAKTITPAKKKQVIKKKAIVRKSSAAKEKIPKKKTAKKITAKKKTTKKKLKKATSQVKISAPNREKIGKDYMNPTQTEGFRQLLLSRKRDLMVEVERTVHHMRDEASNFPDPNDRATQEEEFALELRTRDRERKLVRKIDDALLTLDSGEYGYCEVCGIEIGAKRLEARPTATLCIDCKTLDEIKERQLS